mgnify:CR=1 FL=1
MNVTSADLLFIFLVMLIISSLVDFLPCVKGLNRGFLFQIGDKFVLIGFLLMLFSIFYFMSGRGPWEALVAIVVQ